MALTTVILTDDELESLRQAIAIGATSVNYSGPDGAQSVTYRSLADMLSLYEAELRCREGIQAPTRFSTITYDRGLGPARPWGWYR